MKKNELYHEGVQGQQWYYRRWQYPDGSLTPDGYIHYYGHPKGMTSEEYVNRQRKKNVMKKKLAGAAANVAISGAISAIGWGLLPAALNAKIVKTAMSNGMKYVMATNMVNNFISPFISGSSTAITEAGAEFVRLKKYEDYENKRK